MFQWNTQKNHRDTLFSSFVLKISNVTLRKRIRQRLWKYVSWNIYIFQYEKQDGQYPPLSRICYKLTMTISALFKILWSVPQSYHLTQKFHFYSPTLNPQKCVQIFKVAFFITAKKHKKLKCPPTDEWVNKI